MPYGSGPIVRQALMHATPWQRYVIAAVMVVGGAALMAVGHLAGALLAIAGIVLLVRLLQGRRRRPATAQPRPEENRGER